MRELLTRRLECTSDNLKREWERQTGILIEKSPSLLIFFSSLFLPHPAARNARRAPGLASCAKNAGVLALDSIPKKYHCPGSFGASWK
jgi:hypothetical protein